MSAQTWRVVPCAFGAILVVDHSCGHDGAYAYGGEEFAKRDADTQQAKKCLDCHNRAELERYRKLTGADFAPNSKVTP